MISVVGVLIMLVISRLTLPIRRLKLPFSRRKQFFTHSKSSSQSEQEKCYHFRKSEEFQWMQSFCEKFYLQGSAQKHFLKTSNQNYQIENDNKPMPSEIYDKLKASLSKSVLTNDESLKVLVLSKSSTNTNSRIEQVGRIMFTFASNTDELFKRNHTSPFYDVVVMPYFLSSISDAASRLSWIQHAASVMFKPVDPPHRTSLLFLFESESDFTASTNITGGQTDSYHGLLNQWRQAVRGLGFDLVKQRIVEDTSCTPTTRTQAFVFGHIKSNTTSSSSSVDKLWLSRDFVSSSKVQHKAVSHDRSKDDTGDSVVGIIGGGLGGSALALALQQKGIRVRIYEKDESFLARKQGYALTIQQGAIALRSLDVLAEVSAQGCLSLAHVSMDSYGAVVGSYGVRSVASTISRDGESPSVGSRMQVVGVRTVSPTEYAAMKHSSMIEDSHINDSIDDSRDEDGRVNDSVFDHAVSKKGKALNNDPLKRRNIHIPRQTLREILVSKIDPAHIQWSKKLLHFEDNAKSDTDSTKHGVKLHFEDGSHDFVSVLIAADGIHSTIRKKLMLSIDSQQQSLRYLGLIVILGISPRIAICDRSSSGTPSGISSGRHQVQWVDGSTRVFTMPYDETHTMWQLSYALPESEALNWMSQPHRLKVEALSRLHGWHTPLLEMVAATDEALISGHPAYDRDPPSEGYLQSLASSDSLITLLGDAAHPMSPFKGQGANQALLDAHILTKALVSSSLYREGRRSIQEALREYELDMWERSSVKVLKSRSAADYLHSDVALAVGDITRAAAAEAKSVKNDAV